MPNNLENKDPFQRLNRPWVHIICSKRSDALFLLHRKFVHLNSRDTKLFNNTNILIQRNTLHNFSKLFILPLFLIERLYCDTCESVDTKLYSCSITSISYKVYFPRKKLKLFSPFLFKSNGSLNLKSLACRKRNFIMKNFLITIQNIKRTIKAP